MEPIYVVAITVGAVFLVLLGVCLISYLRRREAAKDLKEELDETYSDPDLAKMEYDIAYYDEEIQSRINAMNQKRDEQVTIEDVMRGTSAPSVSPEQEAIFAKIDDEGMEEISGNYKPDGK
ncbi:MAG: hypothetical protein LUD27_07735 [Clostridia bacterium]|nr:hypothetical protein [Clostridia bacterium]